jgi:hypothetical protein
MCSLLLLFGLGALSVLQGRYVFEGYIIERVLDSAIEFLPHPAGGASPGLLAHARVRQAIHEGQRALDGAEDLAEPDSGGRPRQEEAPARTPHAAYQPG